MVPLLNASDADMKGRYGINKTTRGRKVTYNNRPTWKTEEEEDDDDDDDKRKREVTNDKEHRKKTEKRKNDCLNRLKHAPLLQAP